MSITSRNHSPCTWSVPFAGIPSEKQQVLRQLGRRWNSDISGNRQAVLDLYSSILSRQVTERYTAVREMRYGAHARNTLDILYNTSANARPVVMFFHGGAFTRGSKRVTAEIYENVPLWFCGNGFVGINVEYRLAPEINYPEGARDVAAAVEWAVGNIAQYGGDPQKIILVGHSAGGAHVASYLVDPNLGAPPRQEVCAAVLISARLMADQHPENPNAAHVGAYFGDSVATYEQKSPTTYAGRCKIPLFLAIAEYENRFLDSYGAIFFAEVAKKTGRAPRFLQLTGHNHTSIVAHFGTEEQRLGSEILCFLRDELKI